MELTENTALAILIYEEIIQITLTPVYQTR